MKQYLFCKLSQVHASVRLHQRLGQLLKTTLVKKNLLFRTKLRDFLYYELHIGGNFSTEKGKFFYQIYKRETVFHIRSSYNVPLKNSHFFYLKYC